MIFFNNLQHNRFFKRKKIMVPGVGFEPTRNDFHRFLRPTCLPIPPPGLFGACGRIRTDTSLNSPASKAGVSTITPHKHCFFISISKF